MNSKRKIEAHRWFQQAFYDLKATRWNIQGGFYDTACFLAQQAAGKVLKALLYFHGARKTALLTHSLVEMVREGVKKAEGLTELLDQARELVSGLQKGPNLATGVHYKNDGGRRLGVKHLHQR